MKLIAIGKIKEAAMKSLIQEYTKRGKGAFKVEMIEVDAVVCKDEQSSTEIMKVMDEEARQLLRYIKETDVVVLLDLHGVSYSSERLASLIEDTHSRVGDRLVFVIAGSYGWGELMVERSNYRWKLSDCTFPHQLVRLLVVEQLYRASKIINRESYHK